MANLVKGVERVSFFFFFSFKLSFLKHTHTHKKKSNEQIPLHKQAKQMQKSYLSCVFFFFFFLADGVRGRDILMFASSMSVHMTCPGGEAINWVKEFFYLEICVCVCVYVCVLKKVWTGHVGENSYDLRVQ